MSDDTSTPVAVVDNPWRLPAGRRVLPFSSPDSDLRVPWLTARQKGVTASEVAGLIIDEDRQPMSPWHTPLSIYVSKKTEVKQEEVIADHFMWGHMAEPLMLKWFTYKTGIATRRVGLIASREHPYFMATLDAMSADGGCVEVKTQRGKRAHLWRDDDRPDEYELQVQWQLMVSGRPHGWLAAMVGGVPEIRKVEGNPVIQETLKATALSFLTNHVWANKPPTERYALDLGYEQQQPHDPNDVAAINYQEAYELAERWNRVKSAVKLLVEEEKALRATLLSKATKPNGRHAGKLLVRGTDEVFAYVKRGGAMSASRLSDDNPWMHAQYLNLPTVKFNLPAFKTEEPELYNAYRPLQLNLAPAFVEQLSPITATDDSEE